MAKAHDLPQEVWERIVAHLPRRELDSLIRVNRQLFEIVLDERYRVVTWANVDTDLLKNLRRLRDPAIASHVRCLYIRPWSLRKLFGIPPTPMEGIGCSPIPFKPQRPKKLRESLSRFLLPSPVVQYDTNGVPISVSSITSFLSSPRVSTKEMLSLMTQAVGLTTNLKALVIEWRNLPLNLHASTFLQTIPSSHLCFLTLNTSLNKLRPLLTLLRTPQLEELNLDFEWEDARGVNIRLAKENEAILVDVLVPYLRSLTSTLRSLRIISHASGDHSLFFSALPNLPHLRHLVLEIPFSKRRFTTPQALADFLQSNAFSLTHLEILIQREWDNDREEEMKLNWAEFYKIFLRMDPWLTNLRSFCITAPPKSCQKSCTQTLLNRLPPTITTLRLAHRYYSQAELISIASIISLSVGGLKDLTINVVTIPSPETLKEVSIQLPELWSLTFVIDEEDETIESLYYPYETKKSPPTIEWNLYDLGVYYRIYRKGRSLLGSLDPGKYSLPKGPSYYCQTPPVVSDVKEHYRMCKLREAIWKGQDGDGGVKSFKGTGHMMRNNYW